MTPSELKYHVEQSNDDSKFFSRENMKFAGDTMKNFGVHQNVVPVGVTYENGICTEFKSVKVWELYRKNATRKGFGGSFYFNRVDYTRVYPLLPHEIEKHRKWKEGQS